jgi:hypothetical protein
MVVEDNAASLDAALVDMVMHSSLAGRIATYPTFNH